MSLQLTSIPVLEDNYVWMLTDSNQQCIIVDPGEAAPVLEKINALKLHPVAILLTHHHYDHVDGVAELRRQFPEIVVYGPEETLTKGTTHCVSEGDVIPLLGADFQVIATPGHTLGHVSYYSAPYLFCGDTMFSGGCGRLFEGTAQDMYHSFEKINALPAETLICCAHEYTLSNMKFAIAVYPQHPQIVSYFQHVKNLRQKNKITLPVTLQSQREANVFLMTQDIDLINNLSRETPLNSPVEVFSELRRRKDTF